MEKNKKLLAVYIIIFCTAFINGCDRPKSKTTNNEKKINSRKANIKKRNNNNAQILDIVSSNQTQNSKAAVRASNFEKSLSTLLENSLKTSTGLIFAAKLVDAMTNNYLDFKQARKYLWLQKHDNEFLEVLDYVISNAPLPYSRQSALEFDKIWVLGDLGKYNELYNFCCERTAFYEKEYPDGGAKICLPAGDKLWNAGREKAALELYLKARELSDPAVYNDARQKKFGCATHEAARLLIQFDRKKEAERLIKDALSKINQDISWVDSLKRIQTKLKVEAK